MIPFRRLLTLILAAAFALQQSPACAYTLLPGFLCDVGIQYFNDGRYDDALAEFNRALVLEPDNSVALKYIGLITGLAEPPQEQPETAAKSLSREIAVRKALEDFSLAPPAAAAPLKPIPFAPAPSRSVSKTPKSAPNVILLDESLKSRRMPIELARDRQLILRGLNIRRFLITEPRVLRAEKTGQDEVTVTGNDLGYTYLHIWDERDRWTLEFLGLPPKPEGVPTLEEELLNQEEQGRNFKLRYSVNWQSFESGAELNELKRSSYSWNHWLALTGPTPYGDLDAQTSVSDVRTSTDMTYLTLGLTNGKWEELEGFNVRLVDFNPNISNLAFSSTSLRGAYFNSPAFNRQVDYTVFWGKEGGGKYWGLSPGLSKPKDSYLDGFVFNFMPAEKRLYSFSAFEGRGNDRQETLHSNGYDFKAWAGFDRWDYRYEVAHDTASFANLFSAAYHIPGFAANTELRHSDKEFMTLTGTGWRAGETGILSTADWKVSEKLDAGGRLDVYRDRLFPNPNDNDRLNEDLNLDGNYHIDDTSSLRFDYNLQNDLGKISPMRSHNAGTGIYKSFGAKRWLSTYATLRHQETTFFSTHVNDYTNEKLLLGLRFPLIADLYYYFSHEYNWLQAKYYATSSNPWAAETGLDWNRQIFKSPFYGNFRLVYRNEEDTTSPVSFLAGEDYLEWSAELSYRPDPDFETFLSARVRNVWPESPESPDRVDLNLYAGLRYTWDTGLRWDTVGDVEGYVFKDENHNGLRERGEAPVKGVKVNAGKSRQAITDKNGYFYFSRLKGRGCPVGVNPASLPQGFVLTTPAIQEVALRHGQIETVNFGLTSRTEIWGLVFEDKNGNGKFEQGDKPVKGVALLLDNGRRAVTDSSGKYHFGKISPGKYRLTLEINTLSPDLLPSVPVYREVELAEGASFVYNIPCRKITPQ